MPSPMTRSRTYQTYLSFAATAVCSYLLGSYRAVYMQSLMQPTESSGPLIPSLSLPEVPTQAAQPLAPNVKSQEGEVKSLSVEEDTFEPDPATGTCSGKKWPAGETPLYIITPTYRKAEQLPELTRLAQTLLHVTSLVWIVAEDAPKPTQSVLDYLKRSGLCYVYVRAEMPPEVRASIKDYSRLPRGNVNRNAAIEWIRKTAKKGGVMYLADDDNTYDIRIFEEIRKTKRLSMFPVGLLTNLMLSSPIVKNETITGFYDGSLGRKFPVDMAGFAVHVEQVIKFEKLAITMTVGNEETWFVEHLEVPAEEIEPLADGCTKILVWHTRTEKNTPAWDPPAEYDIADSNIYKLLPQLWKGNE